MVAGKQIDVVTAGLIVGKRIAARPTPTGFWASLSICARRGHCGSWLASDEAGTDITPGNGSHA